MKRVTRLALNKEFLWLLFQNPIHATPQCVRGRNKSGEEGVSKQQDRPVDLYQLDLFLTTASMGSMSAAATAFGISQSAVSQGIAQLEQSLGLVLIDRARRPLSLTSAGLYVTQNAAPLIALARQLKAHATEASKNERAYLRIGMIDSVANTIGPSLIKQLVERTSGLSVQIGMAIAQEEALVNRELDLIISTNAFVDNPVFDHQLLYKEHFVAIASRDASRDGRSTTLRMLADVPFISFRRTSTLGIRVERILRYNELSPPRRLEVDHADTLTLLVAQGLGWAITTPTCLLQTGARFVDNIELIPIEIGNSARSIFLVGRRGEFPALSKDIAGMVKESLWTLLSSHFKLQQFVPTENYLRPAPC
ncbi:LysR family transcriptional regulator [Paraburkholderia sp. RL18-103-BIB-C]|jgi:DNA-binding transcriptional LysR family regulator|uniref:LysR family transcriptional regulator n=1 Tax=unclassified Paraburkholderia TaxID=2615204 RepID=UPI0038B9F33E